MKLSLQSTSYHQNVLDLPSQKETIFYYNWCKKKKNLFPRFMNWLYGMRSVQKTMNILLSKFGKKNVYSWAMTIDRIQCHWNEISECSYQMSVFISHVAALVINHEFLMEMMCASERKFRWCCHVIAKSFWGQIVNQIPTAFKPSMLRLILVNSSVCC